MAKRKTKSNPPVFISATFVAAKNGSKPSLSIHNPVDLTDSIGTFQPEDFVDLKDAISDIVKDRLYNLWFHKDKNHSYQFDDTAFSEGSIFVMAKKRKEGESDKTKITASRLVSINSPQEFEKHVKTVADTVCRRPSKPSRRNNNPTKPRVEHYNVQLCVALVKEKVKKVAKATSAPPPPPVQTIVTSSNSSSNSSTSSNIHEINDSSTPPTTEEAINTTSKKRKSRDPYKFPARSIRLILHAPIETTIKKCESNWSSIWNNNETDSI